MLKKTLSILVVISIIATCTLMANACGIGFGSSYLKSKTFLKSKTLNLYDKSANCQSNYGKSTDNSDSLKSKASIDIKCNLEANKSVSKNIDLNAKVTSNFDFNNASCFKFKSDFDYKKDFKLSNNSSCGVSKKFKWSNEWAPVLKNNLVINSNLKFNIDSSSLDVYNKCLKNKNYSGIIVSKSGNIQYTWDLLSKTLLIVDIMSPDNCIKIDLTKCKHSVDSNGTVQVDVSNNNTGNNDSGNNNKDVNKSSNDNTNVNDKDKDKDKDQSICTSSVPSASVTSQPANSPAVNKGAQAPKASASDKSLPKTGESNSTTIIFTSFGILLVLTGSFFYLRKRVFQ